VGQPVARGQTWVRWLDMQLQHTMTCCQ
jgi:hypothetical protein